MLINLCTNKKILDNNSTSLTIINTTFNSLLNVKFRFILRYLFRVLRTVLYVLSFLCVPTIFLSLKRDRFVLGYTASLVATSVTIFRTIGWIFVGEAKRAPSADRCMLAHGHIFTGSESDSWSGRASS